MRWAQPVSPWHVNNHYWALLAATGIQAVLNIGTRTIAGSTTSFNPTVSSRLPMKSPGVSTAPATRLCSANCPVRRRGAGIRVSGDGAV